MQNNILNPQLFNFDLFAISDPKPFLKRGKGKGEKGILAIYVAETSDPELESFLKKVLAAANIKLENEVWLLHLHPGEHPSLSALRQAWPFSHVLAFGLSPGEAGIHFHCPAYVPMTIQGITYLFADLLRTIQEERQAGGKKMAGQLWKALQKIFLKKN